MGVTHWGCGVIPVLVLYESRSAQDRVERERVLEPCTVVCVCVVYCSRRSKLQSGRCNPNQISLAVEMSKVRERERDYVRLYSLFPSQCYTNVCLVCCNNNNDVFYCAV